MPKLKHHWSVINRRRGELIDKKIARTITEEETAELVGLQAYARAYIEHTTPLPMAALESLEAYVRRAYPQNPT